MGGKGQLRRDDNGVTGTKMSLVLAFMDLATHRAPEGVDTRMLSVTADLEDLGAAGKM